MTTPYKVCSVGFTKLRANVINSFDDGTNESDIAAVQYEPLVRQILSRIPWKFALKKRLLSRTSSTPANKWQYIHTKPSEALAVHSFYESESIGAPAVKEFEILNDGIYSNYPVLYADYTFYKPEAGWPDYFAHFMGFATAADFAMAVTDSLELSDYWQKIAYGLPNEGGRGGEFAIAAGIDARQAPGEELYNNEIAAFRFS